MAGHGMRVAGARGGLRQKDDWAVGASVAGVPQVSPLRLTCGLPSVEMTGLVVGGGWWVVGVWASVAKCPQVSPLRLTYGLPSVEMTLSLTG